MDVSDVIDENGVIRLRAHYALGVGRLEPIPDQTLAIVSGGRVVATAASEDGAAELTSVPDADALGIYRLAGRESADPLTCIEEDIAVIRPASRPLVLFNSNLVESELRLLSRVEGADLLAVRMRVTESCRAIRARLRKAGLRDSVVDARAVLDEGSALDVGNDLDSVRLARVATRMRAAGFPIAAIVYQGAFTPSTIGFAAIRPEQIPSNLSLQLPSRRNSFARAAARRHDRRAVDRRKPDRARAGQRHRAPLVAGGHRRGKEPRAPADLHGASTTTSEAPSRPPWPRPAPGG